MKITLESHFRRGMSIIEIVGEFPNYTTKLIDRALECTYVGDSDDTHDIEISEDDSRALFLCRFWGVSSHSFERSAEPLTEAARKLCEKPLPRGWCFKIYGHDYGGAYGSDTIVKDGTIEKYVLDFAAGRSPNACSPADRKAAYEAKKVDAIAKWEGAGLDGARIWDEKIQWSLEPAVIELADKLAGRWLGYSNSHRSFEKINGFKSPLSFPRTQVAEKMAALTCRCE